MDRNSAILFGVIVPAGGPIADDTTVDPTPLVQFRRTRTRVQVVAELTDAYGYVAAFNNEDGASALSRHGKSATKPLLDVTERGLLKSHRYADAPKEGEHRNGS